MSDKSLFLYLSLANMLYGLSSTASEGRNPKRERTQELLSFYTPLGVDLKLAWVGLSSPGHFQGCLVSSFPRKVS